MFTIRKATTADCALIQKLAQQIFPVTYKDILTPEQTEMDTVSFMFRPALQTASKTDV